MLMKESLRRRPEAKSPPPLPRRRGEAMANDTNDFSNLIYHKKKMIIQWQKSIDNLDSLHTPATYQIPPPPPTVPPPQSSLPSTKVKLGEHLFILI